ncbi:MAG: S8 family peptidase [Pseudonocardiaceae bacterium]
MSENPELPVSPSSAGLIVDLDYLDLVTAELSKLGVGAQQQDTDDRLGLTLLKDLQDAGSRPLTDLDGLLCELRRRFSAKYSGWLPAIGKNRDVDVIVLEGTSRSMASADPMATDPGPTRLIPAHDAGSGVRVGVVDTPLSMHPSFDPQLVHGNPLFEPAAEPVSRHAGHGTFVASLILAQAPAAKLDVGGVLDPTTGRGGIWETAKKMMLLNEFDILNLSFGSYTADGEPPLVIRRAIERLSPDVVVVAAAGNHGDTTTGWKNGRTHSSPTYPAALSPVVAVGATDESGQLAPFSAKLPWVTCTALGVNVEGAYLHATVQVHDVSGALVDKQFRGHATWSGTSLAAATVSGRIAAMTVPGKVTARQALDELLAGDPEGVVKKYIHAS